MWPPWSTSPGRSSPSRTFSFSTFKDIISLVNEEKLSPRPPQPDKAPASPRKIASIFHRVRTAANALRSLKRDVGNEYDHPNRVVLYVTSMRVIRKTFDDCRTVRSILQGLRLAIDERDLSMHRVFREELKVILGRDDIELPRVFIGGRCIGGADEILQLLETGELKNVVKGLEVARPGDCEACGGVGFEICNRCNGSRKCYADKGGFQSCTGCNENGLVRCTSCSR